MSEKIEHVKCLIMGGGPAGYTAAIYAARADMKPVMYQGLQPGGQLTITTEVENYPGFPKGLLGPEMMDLFRQQAERFGTQYIYGDVSQVDLQAHPFRLQVGKESHTCEALIIATGASAKLLNIESEKL